ncbi:MAG TPA: enoyl-CoA hydratase/isomerase family protein, partial [Myxococcota bacterium]|nr:enoyl-CoA hydratase/isomerase family protein [Myxococcota bacterium]
TVERPAFLAKNRFGLPETGLGILPGAGGSAELWALVGVGQALRLGMTGERIGAEEAVRIGLVQELQPDLEAAMVRARRLIDLILLRSPTAVAAYKGAVLAAVGRDPAERQALEACAYEHCVDSGEAARGRANFDAILKGSSPEWGPLRRWSP